MSESGENIIESVDDRRIYIAGATMPIRPSLLWPFPLLDERPTGPVPPTVEVEHPKDKIRPRYSRLI